MASLEELRQISPPPSCLTQTEWDGVGFAVPADYREIVDTYGPGSFGDFLWVMQPVHSEDRLSTTAQIPLARRTLHELANDVVPSEVPYDIDSLIPCAFTANGDTVYWVAVEADPADWPVVVNPAREEIWDEYDGSLLDFLVDVLGGDYSCPVFPTEFPAETGVALTPYGR